MVLIIKLGDRVMESALSEQSLKDLRAVASKTSIVLVHGGGGTVTRVAENLGIQQKFVVSPEGFRSRYTDEETVQVYTMVMAGKINKNIVRRLQQAGIPAVGLSGLDGGLIRAQRKQRLVVAGENGRKRVIDGGYTGRITGVNAALLESLIESGYVPVIAPIAMSEAFEPLNVDGDRTAAYVAGALRAEQLLLLTDVDGLSYDGQLVSTMNAGQAKQLLPRIGPGMITKTYAALEAVSMGVKSVKIGKGTLENPFSTALSQESGTRILP
jgi:[amino group carrier protein]-L-2-aminoadipate 6-kinase